jgi:hypothetical protein
MVSMRRGCLGAVMVFATCAAVVVGGGGTAGAGIRTADSRGGGWGKGIEVPGIGALNSGGDAGVGQLSCSSPGNCTVGGFYTDRSGHQQAVLASEARGRWGRAEEVPGTAALNRGGAAEVDSVSCAAKGACAAAGSYVDFAGHIQLFVTSEASGRWGRARELPGLGHLNTLGYAELGGLACPSPGHCLAAGVFRVTGGRWRAFAASQAHDRWGQPVVLSGANLGATTYAGIGGVACTSAGNCVVGGTDRKLGTLQPIVASEHDGTWARATAISVPAALGTDTSGIDSLSCPSAGNCAAGGSYELVNVMTGVVSQEAFVVNESGGIWGQVQEVPGTAELNVPGGLAVVLAVSCGAAGVCVAGGGYDSNRSTAPAFLAEQADGQWGDAIDVPGLASLNSDGNARVESVSCVAAGNCAAAGFYLTPRLISQLFVISQADGVWGNAFEVPGLAALGAGRDAGRNISVSCPAAGHCALATDYTDHKGHIQLLVDSQR